MTMTIFYWKFVRAIGLASLMVFFSYLVFSQVKRSTEGFAITGEVNVPITLHLTDFTRWKEYEIADIVITNHLGERKSEAKGMKGVLFKEVLASVEFAAENPRILSEYYFVCKGKDGYTVVYSWNELFNTTIGESVYIVTSKNGVRIQDMDDAVLMVAPKDFRTGRRYVKFLEFVEVKRAR